MRTYTKTRLRRIVDGDTMDVVVDLGFRINTEVRVRLIGVDTPERGEDGYHDAIGILHDLMFRHAMRMVALLCPRLRLASMEGGLPMLRASQM